MKIYGIDPGPTSSGLVIVNSETLEILEHDAARDNQQLRTDLIHASLAGMVVCEWVESFGMAVGSDVFRTVRWIGRFEEVCAPLPDFRVGLPFVDVTRKEVKLTLCGNYQAKAKNIRQAVIDKYGGNEVALGVDKTGFSCTKCGSYIGEQCVYRGAPMKNTHKERPALHGQLVGVSSHAISALAVVLTYLARP